ncbi:hypothetical protein [Methylocapsa acidiphila]|uniref:hypothetical protein n=1 Tax=Methylocapsa acidiphila TaxID=133552 RepID=UPI0012EBC0E6|nr:hypothetical protein [Methylocapsa acidiphila]
MIAEIVHSCSNEKVAQAAVASIGSDFAGKVGATASAYGMSIGAFTAHAVRRFDQSVGEDEKKVLRQAMRGSDQPILYGLRRILLPVVETID